MKRNEVMNFGWPSSYSVETVKLFIFVRVMMAPLHSE